jgi:hypothetical protein
MEAAANNGSEVDLRVRPLLDAGMDLALAGIPVLPCHWPVEAGAMADGWTRLACSCGRPSCATPARHAIGGMTVSDASTDPVLVAQWWTGGLWEANVATVAGVAFDAVELRYSARPAKIRAWLAAGQVAPGPVLDAGIGRCSSSPRSAHRSRGSLRWVQRAESAGSDTARSCSYRRAGSPIGIR